MNARNNLLVFVVCVISIILFSEIVAATGSAGFVNYQSQADFQQYYSQSDLSSYWPVLTNKDDCRARQDFLLMVAPAGCQPAVVRSDLLADQNVPVFCQIDALQINPLIDVKQIRNIRFGGKYPATVVGTGFHPARAALRTRDMLLGSPIINNIGYVVVVLKRTPNEKDMPDYVTVNLSAQLDYEAGNSLGVGRAEFILEPVSDSDWEIAKARQSFWNGRYFVRLNEVDENNAAVSVYFGDRLISTVSVKKGQVSREIYFPGSYCMAAVQVAYDSMEASKSRAVLEISGVSGTDTVEVYRGSRFLDDACVVQDIGVSSSGGIGNLSIACGSKGRFMLRLDPLNYKFNVNDEVFLAGQSPSDIWTISGADTAKGVYTIVNKADSSKTMSDVSASVIVASKVSLSDKLYDAKTEEAFKQAIAEYEQVANDYPQDKPKDVEIAAPYGEAALYAAIDLSRQMGKYATEEGLLRKIIEKYPNSQDINKYNNLLSGIYQNDASNASAVVDINGKYSTVSLKGFKLPGDKPSVDLSWNTENIQGLGENEARPTSDRGKVILKRIIDINRAEVVVQCPLVNSKDKPVTTTVSLRTGQDAINACSNKVSLRLNSVNAKVAARIRILPKAIGTETETNLTVKIGIEKRAIKLSTDKTKDMIKNINESIQKWESISKRLEKVVTGLKTTCLATAAAITVKNFISGASGEAKARQDAMNGPTGWKKKCESMVANKEKGYRTMTQCFSGEADAINKEIGDRTDAMNDVNKRIVAAEGQPGVTSGNLLSGKSIDEKNAIKAYYTQLVSKYGTQTLDGHGIKNPDSYANGNIPYTYSDMRDVDYDLQMKGKSSAYGFADTDLRAKQSKIADSERVQKEVIQTRNSLNAQTAQVGVGAAAKPAVGTILPLKTEGTSIILGGKPVTSAQPADVFSGLGADAAMIVSGRASDKGTLGTYLVVGKKDGKILNPLAVYEYNPSDPAVQIEEPYSGNFNADFGISQFVDAGDVLKGNSIRAADRQVRYFGSGPDKSLANIVPFDLNNGWYARVESLVGLGNNVKSYDSSGLPKSWRICNVGNDGNIDINDACDLYIEGTSDRPILGQDSATSSRLIRDSRQAIREANNQYGSKIVTVLGNKMQAGALTSPMTATQCQEVMSISDCNILFNVCDPVICPATRCDFGGDYPVSDVIQTGIVGSALLCLPNFGTPQNGGVLIPVCLSGIQAGIDSWVSILKNHRDCLQESLNTGRLVGICDQLTAIYTCDFFWKQVAPVANMLVPKLINIMVTGGRGEVRGGGEYMNTLSAWNNAKSSVDYMTQTYAVNSFKAFQARSIEEVGSEFCKARISGKGPTALKSLAEAESPPQFTASFQAMKYSDATVPATAQYKVFYHIYAGKNAGAYYSVYLKNPPNSPYYPQSSTIQVATGFVRQGAYASETKDFTAPEGYQELCVRINAEEKCGFQQVSTSFAVNYITDSFVANQAKEKEITTESGCVSGSPNFGGLLVNPTNLQAGVQETVSPQISNRGIVRICSTLNPGQSTSPSRYVEVGYCGDKNMKCWLDKNSASNAISDNNAGVRNQTLQQIDAYNKQLLGGNPQIITDEGEVNAEVTKMGEIQKDVLANIGDAKKVADFRARADSLVSIIVFNHQKAKLLLMKADVDAAVVRNLVKPQIAATMQGKPVAPAEKACISLGGVCEECPPEKGELIEGSSDCPNVCCKEKAGEATPTTTIIPEDDCRKRFADGAAGVCVDKVDKRIVFLLASGDSCAKAPGYTSNWIEVRNVQNCIEAVEGKALSQVPVETTPVTTLPVATVGAEYRQVIVSGITAKSFSCELPLSSRIPSGMRIDKLPDGCVLVGTPTATGEYSFVFNLKTYDNVAGKITTSEYNFSVQVVSS